MREHVLLAVALILSAGIGVPRSFLPVDCFQSPAAAFSVVNPAGQLRSRTSRDSGSSSRLFAEKERLSFATEINICSEPLPSTDRDEVYAFFRSDACRNHFLSGGGKSVLIEESRTPELEACWKHACDSHYGSRYLPVSESKILSTETSIQFPGLRIVNRVYTGVQRRAVNDEENRAGGEEYQALLIAEKRSAYGPPPLVWLYHQLTGSNKKNAESDSDETGESSGYALTRIYIVDEERADATAYKIEFDCTVEVLVQFPRFLLKILPTSKQKMEEQGSASVKKAIEKDVLRAVKSTSEAFQDWKAKSVSTIG